MDEERKTESQDSLAQQTPTIERLSDPILLLIFRFLSCTDLINIERVSKRWRRLSRATWLKRKPDWTVLQPHLLPDHTADTTSHVIRSFLKRSPHLRSSLMLDLLQIQHDDNILFMIATLCPDIRELSLYNMNVSRQSVRAVAIECHDIRSLTLNNVESDYEHELCLLLANNPKLVELEMENLETITGRCLANICSDGIETLKIVNCEIFNEAYLQTCECLIRNLKNLTLESELPLPNLHVVNKLRNLVFLTLHVDNITDDLLIAIGKECQRLKSVYFSITRFVTVAGIYAMLDLPLLERFQVIDDDDVFRDTWRRREQSMPYLKSMMLIRDNNLSEDDLLKIVDLSPMLESIELIRCGQFSVRQELVDALTAKVRARGKSIELIVNCQKHAIS